MSDSSLQLLLDVIDQGFDRPSWHGPNLRGSLRGVTHRQGCWRPKPKRHNIWEHLLHAAYWKYTVRRRILGEKRGSFAIKGSNWISPPETTPAALAARRATFGRNAPIDARRDRPTLARPTPPPPARRQDQLHPARLVHRKLDRPMGHAISAAVLRGAFAADRAKYFDLSPIACKFDLTVFPLHACYCDYWDEKLGISGFLSDRPLLDCQVVHHILHEVAATPMFAIIETDYWAGVGDQAAVAYRGSEQIMAPEVARRGPINKALKLLGAHGTPLRDAFDTIGLRRFRDWDDLFSKYDPR